MRQHIAGLIAGSVLAVAGNGAFAASRCAASDAELLAAIQAVQDKQHNVGVQAAIWRDDRLVFSRGLGLADAARHVPVTPRTLFPVASLTKAFTGIATLQAVDAGKLDLDTPIQTYVADFPVKPELTITARRLAAHRAGIHHWGPERDALFKRHFDDLAQVVALFRDDPLLPRAGAEYQYSSYGYNLLALAVQNARGRPFTGLVESGVLRPLRLNATRFDDARRRRPGTTRLYSFYDLTSFAELSHPVMVPDRDYSHNLAAGNMSSTAGDLARFGAALFAPGLVSASSWELLFHRPDFGGVASPMSFGFFAPRPGAERRLNINGSNPGVQSGLVIVPGRRVAVAVLANTWGVGSRSGEFGSDLPQRLADLCAPTT